MSDFPNCKWLQLPTVTSTVTILDVTRHLFREDSPFDFQMGWLVQPAPSRSPRLMLSPWALLCLWHRRCGDGDVGEKHRTTIYIKHHYMVLDLGSHGNIWKWWILSKHAWWMLHVHCSFLLTRKSEGSSLGILRNFARGHPCASDHWKGWWVVVGPNCFVLRGYLRLVGVGPVDKGVFCRCGDLSARTCEDLKFFDSFKTLIYLILTFQI